MIVVGKAGLYGFLRETVPFFNCTSRGRVSQNCVSVKWDLLLLVVHAVILFVEGYYLVWLYYDLISQNRTDGRS